MKVSRHSISKRSNSRGFTLLEVMVALSIGLVLMIGLVTSFVGATKSKKNMQQTSEQIENGRMAVDMLTQDIKMAGYFNSYYLLPTVNGFPAVPTYLPDPCSLGPNTRGLSSSEYLLANSALHVQLYTAPSSATKPDMSASGEGTSGVGTSCNGFLAATNLVAGSDILVIRRLATMPVTAATDILKNMVYMQNSSFFGEIQYGDNTITTLVNKRANNVNANLDGTTPMVIRKPVIDPATGLPAIPQVMEQVAGDIFRYITRIYFVAPCSDLRVCGSSTDTLIPTLKRLDLFVNHSDGTPCRHTDANCITAFILTPMVEGIDSINFDSGIDNSPNTASTSTGFIGDGQADLFCRQIATCSPDGTMKDMADTVSMNIFVLARNTQIQMDYTDNKTYVMSAPDPLPSPLSDIYHLGPFSDLSAKSSTNPNGCIPDLIQCHFRRHVYTSRVRIDNISQRRENP